MPQADHRTMRKHSSRDWVLFVIFLAVSVVILVRLGYVQVVKSYEYTVDAQQQRTSDITLSARRGTIYDRNGNVLATTIDATTIYCNPREVTDAYSTATQIAAILGGAPEDYTGALTKTGVSFAYVARKADVDLAQKIKDLDLPGIYFLDDSKRVYPYNGIGNQIIGVVGVDDKGLSGLELEYDDVLTGTDGELLVERGEDGTPITGGVTSEVPAVDGQDIIVSVDLDLQQYCEEVLSAAVTADSAKGGTITVYDGSTGEIYATCSSPSLDTTDWRANSSADAFTLRSISTPYEPGSTFKAITASAVIDQGAMTKDTEIDVPSSLTADTYTIKDATEHGEEVLTLGQVIAQSSNIGIDLASQSITTESLYTYIVRFGFGSDCGVDFPGVASGYLPTLSNWNVATKYNVPFGQGLSVSALQLARAYGAFANDGTIETPHFLIDVPHDTTGQYDKTWNSVRVIKSSTVDQVTQMLEMVVTEGTGKSAAIDGFTVAGKTGSAQIASDTGGYIDGAYVISFAGFLPDSDSNLVCVVSLDQPTVSTVGDVFADIMSFAIDRYKITQDAS